MDREISPPRVKRRRLLHPGSDCDRKMPTGHRGVRVYSWNINGIQAFISASAAPITSYFKALDVDRDLAQPQTLPHNSLRGFLCRHNWPEVLFLQELKVGPSNRKQLASLLSSLNSSLGVGDKMSSERTYELHYVLPRDKYNAKGFQGRLYGVGTILRKDFAQTYGCRVRHADWDLEGRVSIVETTQQKTGHLFSVDGTSGMTARADAATGITSTDKPLALINVYAVNGTSAEYKSPDTGQVTGTRHDHKLAFHSRLVAECLFLESRGFHVVIAGDLNVARGPWDGHPNLRTSPLQHCVNRADFNAKFFDSNDNEKTRAYCPQPSKGDGMNRCFQGVDVFRAIHGDERRYTYHARTKPWGSSCDRVDLIIVSKGLWESSRIIQTGILDTPAERGPSDHVPIWVEIAMQQPGQDRSADSGKHLEEGVA